jgi:hypothetical protein
MIHILHYKRLAYGTLEFDFPIDKYVLIALSDVKVRAVKV